MAEQGGTECRAREGEVWTLYWDVAELHDIDLPAIQLKAKERVEERMTAENGLEHHANSATHIGEGAEDPLEGPSGGFEYRDMVREELLQQLRSDYRLCALLIDDFVHHLHTKEALLRDQVIDCLRLFLTKTDYDQRWRSAKPLIAQALFPLIPALCEEVEVVVALEPRARRNVLLPFLWILHLLPPPVLHCLWHCEDAEDQVGLLTLLTVSLNDFAYAGIKARESDQSTEPNYTLASESIDHLVNHSMSGGKGGGDGGGGGGGGGAIGGFASSNPATYKRDLERQMDIMYSAHRQKSFNRGRLTTVGGGGAAAAGGGVGGGGGGLTGVGGLASRRDSAQYNTVSGYPLTALLGSGGVGSGVSGVTVTFPAPSTHSTSAPSNPPLVSSASFGSAANAMASSRGGSSAPPSSIASASSPAILSTATTPSSTGGSSSGLSSGGSPSSATLLGSASSAVVGSPPVVGSLRKLRATMAVSTANRQLSSTLRASAFRTVSGGASLSSVHRELVMAIVRFEGALTRQVGRVVLSVVSRFVRFFASSLARSEGSFLEVLRCLTALFSNAQPNSFLLTVFPVALTFIRRFGFALHSSPARQLEFSRLSNAVFRTASFSSKAVRKHAVAVVYQCLMNEFTVKKDLTGLQTQFTVELSRQTDQLTAINERCLQQTFTALTLLSDRYGLQMDVSGEAQWAVEERAMAVGGGGGGEVGGAVEFRLCLQSLLGRLTTILGDSMEINRQGKLGEDADTATTEALLCQVADAFSHLPQVRMEWLKRLAKHHQHQQAYAEAGQAYLLVAQLAAQRKKEEGAGDGTGGGDVGETAESVDRVICSYYEACVSQLDLAELYEQCSDVYGALLPYYHHSHDYHRLSKAHLHLHSIFEKLLEANSKQIRMLGTYYRVGFYGARFGPRLDGREFIYKQPKITRLSEIASHMRSLYSKQLGCTVRILPDSNPVDRSKLDPDECVLQVTFVTPFFGGDTQGAGMSGADGEEDAHTNDVARGFYESVSSPSSTALHLRPTLLTYTGPRPRSSFIEQHSFLSAFKFSTPFTSTGKAFGAVTEQQKRNTVLFVQHPFPAIVTAQLVVRKTETILSAIESATEDVNARTASILEVIDSPHVNHKAVSQIIQGSVATQVHGGAKEICLAFLKPQHQHTAHSAAHSTTGNGGGGGGGRGGGATSTTSGAAEASDGEDSTSSTSLSSSSSSSSPSSLTSSIPSLSSSSALSSSSRANLRSALVAFLDACSRALEVNSRMCTTDGDREWQSNMDRLYEQMLEEMQPFLQPPIPVQEGEGGGVGEGLERSHQGSDSSSRTSGSDSGNGGGGRGSGGAAVGSGGGGGAPAEGNPPKASSSSLRAPVKRDRLRAGTRVGGPPSAPLSVSFNTRGS